MSSQIVLWNAKEAKQKCEEFVRDYAKFRNDLLDHFNHKGHVALRYTDDWQGFFTYCRERLKLESNEQTIRLQISTAQVSREVGVEVPMVISRQLAKLPPEQQKGVYDEVIGARQKAGQRSANQMEPDVRRVVRRVMGVAEPLPVSKTDKEPPASQTNGADLTIVVGAGPRTADVETETANHPPDVKLLTEGPYSEARGLLCEFVDAYEAADQEKLLIVYTTARLFINAN